jgi:hypothetical protein
MERELTSDELDAVSGGGDMLTITKLMDAPSSGGGYVGGGTTPAGAWNDCLRGYGFPPMA